MSIKVIEKHAMEILDELQKISDKLKRTGRHHSDQRQLDIIRNAVVKKIVNGIIPPEHITVDYLAFGCQILKRDAEEIEAYLKTSELI